MKERYTNDEEHRNKHKLRVQVSNKNRNQKIREFLISYLMTHPCVDCFESDLTVLDFDHVAGVKILDIGGMYRRAWTIEKIENEITKCEVRCSNCHRRKTAKTRNDYKHVAQQKLLRDKEVIGNPTVSETVNIAGSMPALAAILTKTT